MPTLAPDALYGVFAQVKPHLSSVKMGGVVGDANHGSGYHLGRSALLSRGLRGDYSIQCPADRRGGADYATGLDLTFGDLAELITVHRRLREACTPNDSGSHDPRIECVREHIGTLDGRRVSGYNRVATGSGTRSRVGWVPSGFSDDSHLWHEHISVLRDQADQANAMTGLAEVIAGLAPGTLGWTPGPSIPVTAIVDHVPLPTYYVDPAKVDSFLWGIDHDTAEAVKRRLPGYAITTGVAIIDYGGRQWLLTQAGYRYALDFLTTSKPAVTDVPDEPAPSPPEPAPANAETLLSLNLRRNTADVPGHEWPKRRRNAVAALRSSGATVAGFQECTDEMGAQVARALGWQRYEFHNVEVQWDPGVWQRRHDNGYRLDGYRAKDRYCVVVVLRHRRTGREIKFASTHLSVNVPDEETWRLRQVRQIVGEVKELDVLFGDFNSSSAVYAEAARLGLADVREKAPADKIIGANRNTCHHYLATKLDGRWIDNVLTRAPVRVLSAKVLVTDRHSPFPDATDHNAVQAAIDPS